MMNEFYTYAYLREDRTPYYIGKGTKDRAYVKHQKGIGLPKHKSKIIFLKKNLTEEEAFKHEIYMIAVFGRKDLGTGILHNRTDGGDGRSNPSPEVRMKMSESHKGKNNHFYGKTHSEKTRKKMSERIISEETKKKLSEVMKGRTHSKETKNKISEAGQGKNNHFYGKTHSEETKNKIAESKRGQKLTVEHRKKLSKAGQGKKNSTAKQYIFISPNGKKYLIEGSVKKFCKEIGITYDSVLGKKSKNTKGWTIIDNGRIYLQKHQ
jgi:hypothetical protein